MEWLMLPPIVLGGVFVQLLWAAKRYRELGE